MYHNLRLITDPFISSELAFAYMRTHARQKALELRQGYRKQEIQVIGCELEVEQMVRTFEVWLWPRWRVFGETTLHSVV